MNKQSLDHYKLYKAGKLWITALVSVAVFGSTVLSQKANADDGATTAAVKAGNDNQVLTNNSVALKSSTATNAAETTTVAANKVATTPAQTAAVKESNPVYEGELLGKAAGFHIFAGKTSSKADTNGNIATGELVSGQEFGTRGQSFNHTSKDTYYISKVSGIGSNAFRTGNNDVVLGDDTNITFNGDQVFINGTRMDHLKKSDVRIIKNHIDIDGELAKLADHADYLAGKKQSDNVVLNFSDMNNRTIDISNVKEKVVFIELPSDFLEQPQDIIIKGLDSDTKDGQVVIINVRSAKDTLNLSTKTRLIYDDNTQLSPNESHAKPNHILWNFGSGVKTVNISSGYFMGSVLAPNAELNVDVNVDGNLVAQTVNIRAGESHRWDLWEPETPIFPRPVIPHGEEEFVEQPKDQGKSDGGKKTPGKSGDDKQPVKPDTDKHQDSNPGQPDQPKQPTSPAKHQDSKPGQPDQPKQLTSPAKSQDSKPAQPVQPSQPTSPAKPQDSKPTQPDQPKQPTSPAESQDSKPTQPDQPKQPTSPAKHQDSQPGKSDQPGQLTCPAKHQDSQPGKSDQPGQPTSPAKQQDSNPGQPTSPAKHQDSQPGKSDQPGQPTSPAKSQDSKPGQPTSPAKHQDSKPDQPVQPTTAPSQPTKPGQASNVTKPTSPVQPTSPSKPTEPGKSSNVTKPTSPVQPTSPSKPTEPGKTTNVTKPTNPVQPTSPSKPTEPGKTTNVTKPTSPVQPTSPSKPTEPGKATNVTKPTSPVQPTNPSKPVRPVKVVGHSQANAESTQLPQTGNKDSKLGILGLMVAGFVAAINLLKKEF